MTTQEAASTFEAQPASKLCWDYYYASGLNVYQPDRKASIERRKLDCTPWKYDALRKKNNEASALLGVGQALSQTNTYSSAGTNLKTGFTKVCRYKGPGGPAAMTISSTALCPPTMNINVIGATKVCNYNEMGGKKAITIRSTEICPLSFPG